MRFPCAVTKMLLNQKEVVGAEHCECTKCHRMFGLNWLTLGDVSCPPI